MGFQIQMTKFAMLVVLLWAPAALAASLSIAPCTPGPATEVPGTVACVTVKVTGDGVTSTAFALRYEPGTLTYNHWLRGAGLTTQTVAVERGTDSLSVVITSPPGVTLKGDVLYACFTSGPDVSLGCTPVTFAFGALVDTVEESMQPIVTSDGGILITRMADGNGDGVRDGADYTVWADRYGKSTQKGPSEGDYNGDGEVDGADYTIWADNFD